MYGTRAGVWLCVAAMPFFLSSWSLSAKEKKEAGKKSGKEAPPSEDADGLHKGLVAHYFKDPLEWDGQWKTGQKPTAEASRFTFHEYFQGESLPQHDPDPAKFFWSCPALKIPRQIVPASHLFHKAADLQDYVPSQGLSAGDKKKLRGGQELATPQPAQLQSWAAVAER